MRTYSGFLLFEDLLDFVSTDNSLLYQFVQDFTNPTVTIKEENCLTTVGKLVDVDYRVEGLIEISTDATITKARVNSLLAAGTYKTSVRNLNSCITVDGVCRRCYQGTYVDVTAPVVGTITRLAPEYNYQTDVWVGNGAIKTFTLSQTPDLYTKVLIIVNGVIQTSGFSISNATLTATVAPALSDHVVIKFYKITTHPFVGYMAKSYSGSLLGMKPLDTQTINIRPSLAQKLFVDQEINLAKLELEEHYKTVPSNYFDYIDSIHDKLEKAIYIGMLYSLYSNVNT